MNKIECGFVPSNNWACVENYIIANKIKKEDIINIQYDRFAGEKSTGAFMIYFWREDVKMGVF